MADEQNSLLSSFNSALSEMLDTAKNVYGTYSTFLNQEAANELARKQAAYQAEAEASRIPTSSNFLGFLSGKSEISTYLTVGAAVAAIAVVVYSFRK